MSTYPLSVATYLEIAEESFRAIISHLHSPIDRHRSHHRTKPTDVLGRAPEHAGALGCNGQSKSKVVQFKLIVLSTDNELIGTISCEGTDGCAQVEGGSSEPGDTLAKLVDVSPQNMLPRRNI